MRKVSKNGINLERISGKEEPKSKYYIIPEGSNTEIQYFCGIRDNKEELNIDSLIEIILIENDENENGQSHPKRKLSNFNRDLELGKFTYFPDFDKVIFVIDRDPQNFSEEQLDEFIKNCTTLGYYICLSNPTFEVLLLMHDNRIFELDRKQMLENKRISKNGKRFLEKKVSEFFSCKKTNLDFDKFRSNIEVAIKNEREFCEELEGLKIKLGSNVGVLLENMMNKK